MKKEIADLVRENIAKLKPYSCARDEFKGGNKDTIFLDANESAYAVESMMNRYPDPLQITLKNEIGRIKSINANNIFLGNGSDEVIDLIFRSFCEPQKDNVVAIDPTYGMYSVCADINNVEYRRVPLGEGYSLDVDQLFKSIDERTKAIFVCSPNNPTGNTFRKEIEQIIERDPDCLLVVDEAYTDFCPKESVRHHVGTYPKLIVMSTFSKAWASAGARLGMAFADEDVIEIMNKVKYPYNINRLTQQYAMDLLHNHLSDIHRWIAVTISERAKMMEAFQQLPSCKKVYSSEANFFLAKMNDANSTYSYLADNNIIVRNRSNVALCGDCLRITIGTKNENTALLKALRQYVQR